MRKSKLFVLMLLFGMFSLVHAQERTISGTVTDAETGEGLPGVSVMVQGTSSGTATDFNGEYSVSVDNNTVLVFSFIGYQSQEVTVGTRSTVDVALVTDVQTLSEVIVVGYGTQTRQEVTSSVTSVKAEDFNQGNVNDPAQLLQGKVPGLMVVRPGGNLNNPFKVRLRGLATIGPNSQPLIIIDGVPSNSLGQVDPNDIAAIDVLKDGAAAAIYGTRGSNGVIIVTTKTGRAGTTSVEYNGYFASESIAKLVPMLDAAGYRANVPAATLKDTDIGSSTDWFDELTQNAKSMTHNLSMMGGTNKTTYRISFNYRDQQGVQKLTGFEQLNTRVNLTQKALNDKLTLTGNFAMTRLNSNLGWDEAFRYATIYNPTAPVRVDGSASGLNPADYESSDGYYQLPGAFDYYNPVALIEQNINEETEKQLNFHLKGDYEIMDGLHFNMAYSQQTENQFRNRYYDKQSFWIGADRNGLANKRQRNDFTKIFEAIGLYDKDINDMNLKVLGGYSWQENVWDEFYAEGGNFVADNFTFNNLGAALDFNNGLGNISSWKTRSNLISFFGRANLNINDTYFLMASYRTDGYSGFGENDKWGGFPAVSAGVNLGNLVDIASVDNLKLRLSYGMTGTLPPRTYESIAKVGPVGSAFVNGSFQPAYGPISNDNPDLKWETKKEFNVGLDFSVLDYKLNGSIDFYDKTTSDLLMDFEVPIPPNLARTTLLNIGEMSNSGL
ncbi:MAG: SusC/RagA family TonB-linked outer membrane protein, partial [Cyclobacteriaceae bacterium]|nr:SusC/RagA family TonB-linked outer membrane protein [Cyclobacteriaceae bacterium]